MILIISVDADELQPVNGILRHRSYVAQLPLSSGTRPRRSASLSDASGGTFSYYIIGITPELKRWSSQEERLSPRPPPSQNQQLYTSRPGSSLDINSARVRRVTSEQDGALTSTYPPALFH